MISNSVTIPIGENESVSGVISSSPAKRAAKGTGVILAHGAANDMENPLIVAVSKGLAESGFITLRFNFLYKEKGRKQPDSQQKLVQTWQSVFQFLKKHPEFGPDKIVAAGKSMGGRVASQMAAEGHLPVDRLVFLGYPLHAPGRKDKLRDAHLYHIKAPMLFFAGTRDALCDVSLLNNVLKGMGSDWELETIEGGDHSFRVPKSAAVSQQAVYDRIMKKTVDWLQG
jgi:predicted alpha/beta-hydrolase family hydrolase